jgi:hypothetical protein
MKWKNSATTKICFCLLAVVVLGAMAEAQTGSATRITLQLEQATLEQALRAVQQVRPFELNLPTDLRTYSLGGVYLEAPSLEQALTQLLAGTNINYAAEYSQGWLRRLTIVGVGRAPSPSREEKEKYVRRDESEPLAGETPSQPVGVAENNKGFREEEKEEGTTSLSSSVVSAVLVSPSDSQPPIANAEMGESSPAAGQGTTVPSRSDHEALEQMFTQGQRNLAPFELQQRAEEWRRFWMEGGPPPANLLRRSN